jgi:uncharacterized linocin/CFP29 family protein
VKLLRANIPIKTLKKPFMMTKFSINHIIKAADDEDNKADDSTLRAKESHN